MKDGGGDLPYALRLLASGETVGGAWKEAGYASRKALADDIYRAADALGSAGGKPPPGGSPRLREQPSRKSPPKGLKLVAYSDGASSGNPGHAGCGVVLLDESGEVLLEDYRYLGETTNNVAEYEGAIFALTRALELGASEIELRVDSGLLANQIKGGYKVRSVSLAPLYRDLKRLSERFASFEIRQITSGQNRQADRLANLGVASRTKE
jgi:ribonuclease HI